MTVRGDICGECPFLRESAKGWLGSNEPEAFALNVLTDRSLACHTMMDQSLDLPEWESVEQQTPRCRGAVTLMRNTCKLPRDPDMAALVRTVPADHANIFSSPKQFVEHHRSGTVRTAYVDRH